MDCEHLLEEGTPAVPLADEQTDLCAVRAELRRGHWKPCIFCLVSLRVPNPLEINSTKNSSRLLKNKKTGEGVFKRV